MYPVLAYRCMRKHNWMLHRLVQPKLVVLPAQQCWQATARQPLYALHESRSSDLMVAMAGRSWSRSPSYWLLLFVMPANSRVCCAMRFRSRSCEQDSGCQASESDGTSGVQQCGHCGMLRAAMAWGKVVWLLSVQQITATCLWHKLGVH
jgi:hypothetical protein